MIYVLKYPINSGFSLNSVAVSTATISPSSGYVYNVIKQRNSVLKYKNDPPVSADSLGIFLSDNASLISGDSSRKFIYTRAENFSIVEKYSDICDLCIRVNGTKQFLTAGLLKRDNSLFVVVLISEQNDKDLLEKMLVDK